MLPNRSFPMSAEASQPSSSAWSRLLGRFSSLDPVLGLFTVVLAGLTYAPSFLTRPGMIAADSKQYLYLDPGKLLSSAVSMWDPDVGAGTVTHQNIGFLFPMGPYYWVVQELHIPMWVGQRFWMGSLFFFAGLGVLFAARLLGLSRWGCVAAALVYTFTPFVIDYIGRISVILMPWAALGWMVGLVDPGGASRRVAIPRALRHRRRARRRGERDLDPARRPGTVHLAALRGLHHARGDAEAGAGRRPAPGRADASACRCGGWPACGPRAPTASTS